MTTTDAYRCRTCNELVIPSQYRPAHRCPPLWRVWCPDQGEDGPDDGRDVRDVAAQYAAEKWAETEDHDYYEYDIIAQRQRPVVHVLDPATGAVTRWRVTGEAVPQYHAEELEDDVNGS